MKDDDITELKALFDSMETLFNQFVISVKLNETVSNELFVDQNKELTLFKQADTAFTVKKVLQAAFLMFSANKDTFFNHILIRTSDNKTVLSKLYI